MYVYTGKMGTKKEYERRFRETGLLKPSEVVRARVNFEVYP